MDDLADDRFPNDDVITCRRDKRSLRAGDSVVALELDTQTYCARWSIAVAATVACDVSLSVRIGETCDAEPYEVKLITSIDAGQAAKLIDAAWIFTGLARRIRVTVSHSGSMQCTVTVKVIADRQAVAPDVVTMPGTQVVT